MTMLQLPVREAPAAVQAAIDDPAFPDASAEDALAVDNIQGNIVGGFNKDFQTLLFLQITRGAEFRSWLSDFEPFIATAAEVLAFNRLFKSVRSRRRVESRVVQSTWINIAFSYRGLQILLGDNAVAGIRDEAFKAGMGSRSAALGDPAGEHDEGSPPNWVVGGSEHEVHAVILVGGDDREDVAHEVARIEDSLRSRRDRNGNLVHRSAHIVYVQRGATLPPPLTGHEHFGFLDGVSQPGLRGRVSKDAHDVLTPRQNPNDVDQGKPGQDLLWPGEFVFGYPAQNPTAADLGDSRGDIANGGLEWMKEGSFLVFRRLRQNVFAFRQWVSEQAAAHNIDPEMLKSRLVGRWPGGAPVLRADRTDNPDLATDDCCNNDFEFQGATPALPAQSAGTQCADPHQFTLSPGDKSGAICPFSSHIRKTYPRDDEHTTSELGQLPLNESDTQTHRLLRRGIPFGDPLPEVPTGRPDSGDRGLLFMAYQTSIVRQFEFVMKQWVNNANLKDPGVGLDPILGQAGTAARQFSLPVRDRNGKLQSLNLSAPPFVIPTGGEYFFAPSLPALRSVLARP